ncbi:angiotensin-converting enzyme-like [Actinia tenebrosa]|uniref:Angiotensin-converting enzyme n=1 Tax=Actinia tenebrosa TaxID=6105 RepID=A0A6P8JA18_ACTTE|nr:angiotensin-converting enzyme-like [Actinia tenebrosa]
MEAFQSLLLKLCLIVLLSSLTVLADEEVNAKAFLAQYNERATNKAHDLETAMWKHATDITEENMKLRTTAYLKYSSFEVEARKNAGQFDLSKLTEDTKRQFSRIMQSATPKDTTKRRELANIIGQMEEIYSSAKVSHPQIGTNLSLVPDLVKIMAESRNNQHLVTAWREWRRVTGPKIRPLYKKFVELSNEGARDNNWEDTGDWWRSWYRPGSIGNEVGKLWMDLKPLYMELHAFVRYRLRKQYPVVLDSEPIPAHLLGNMWSQSWTDIFDLLEPYPGKSSLDLTESLIKRNYTARKIVELAESFFVSIGLEKLPETFYDDSMIERPKGRDVVCHPSAWDFYLNNSKSLPDVRIKQCISITHSDMVTTHHELGHIYYFLGYWNQPFVYRDGANPAFHEALGDTLSLSVDNPQHLVKIGLLDSYAEDKESEVNALMKTATRIVAFLPFAYLVDQWRWKVFNGDIKESDFNKKWWELRLIYQGIKPPVSRDESLFDPGAKYHIPANIPYLRYFLSTVLQFQFHKAACEAAGFKGPLHQCSIYESKAAGAKISAMLKLGRSKPWPKALEIITGSSQLDVGPLKEYFNPLLSWLFEQRCKNNYTIGWAGESGPGYDPCNPPSFLPSTPAPNSRSKAYVTNIYGMTIIVASILAHLTKQFAVQGSIFGQP